MRLIDADALILYLNDVALSVSPFYPEDDSKEYDILLSVIEAIEGTPTVKENKCLTENKRE